MKLKSTIHAACRGLMLVAALCFVAPVSAQNGARGVVKDAEGGGIIGASVVQKNTTNGVSTGVDGAFTLAGVKTGDVLQVSFIGYVPQEVVWKGTPLEIVMVEDAQTLDEVVVVGYGVQKKTNVTGAVSMVDSKAFESRPVQNVAQALQGQVPGLTMSYSSSGGGQLDNELSFNIRGSGTIGSGSKGTPLVLIDGIEGNMNAVNPNDIESVSVLKDAASASIYGARAAFGVILITTKGGKSGKTRVNYTGNVRWSDATQIPEMVDSYSFATYWNAANINMGNGAYFDETRMNRIKTYMEGGYTDPTQPEYYGTIANSSGQWSDYKDAFANTNWFETFYKDWVPSQEHNISISGGTDKLTYFVSGNFLGQNGLIAFGDDNYNRYTMTGKISAQLADWVRMNYTTKWTRSDYNAPTYMSNGGLFYHNIARRWPTCPVYDPNGYLLGGMETIQLEEGGKEHMQKNWYTNQVQFIFEPIKDWHITLDGSLRQYTENEHSEMLPVYAHDVNGDPYLIKWQETPGENRISEYRYTQDYFSTNITTDYSKEINGHYFKVLVGFNAELYKYNSLSGSGEDLISAGVPQLSTTQSQKNTTNKAEELALAGFFGRINYNYKERYLFELNLRYDGSSRFVGDKQWGTFPSVSAGWNIAREAFMEDYTDIVGTLKLRGSWGQLGNNTLDAYYPFYQSISTGTNGTSWLINGEKQNWASLPGIVSSVLTWETVESWDVGFDFAMFKNRFTGSFSYYQRSTYDMVAEPPTLPSILGATPPKANNADMRSYGWELELGWQDRIGKDFKYGVRFTLSDNQQKILKYPNETGSLSMAYYEGMLNDIWGYTTVGIAQSQEEMDAHLKNNKPNWGSNWGAGDIMYADLNGDGVVNTGSNTLTDPGDRRVIGNSTPRYNFGLTLNGEWKGIDFSIFFQGVMKRDYWLDGPYFWGAYGGNEWQSTCFKEHLDYWTPENPNAYYPKPYFGNDKNQRVQTRYLQDASYIRLKNVQVGYTLPKKWTSKAGMESVRIYISGDNLWTGSDISGAFDPELLGGDWGPGKLYPAQRTISIGANINF